MDRGETPKHRGMAQAAFITGIVGLVLSLLATAFWILILVLYQTDEGFRQDFRDEYDSSAAVLQIGALALRAGLALAS